MNYKTTILQGSFPGGKPHASILLQTKMGRQYNGSSTTYQIDSRRLSLTSPGNPLPEGVLQKMESVFKIDFSHVRVHTGREAESIGALAFTTGNDIYFAAGQYNPNTPHGQRLLGHELTHVVQQKSGKVHNPFRNEIAVISDPGLEAEAERMSIKAIRKLIQPSLISSNIIQRSKHEEMDVQELIDSFETEIKRWVEFNSGKKVFETGDCGPTKDRHCRTDVVVTRSTFDSAVKTIGDNAHNGEYLGPSGAPLTRLTFGPSGSQNNVFDIVLDGNGEKINYHITVI